ncbi:uncharacterized protein LOC121243156 [Juglans microcarpa x Juglans regia]|uniref:uncharacterized protein LOC121243156 n=1 Tax=Juglans microcarpa x Juglans regia TaxID=2249226 RepID=UPI001B7DB14C|nr:uncharacterized protein LOC121243156 [Juglans microcarpa x Juglans regia]
MKVPGKMKLFMWKAGNNLLATRVNLFTKKVIENPLYPICLKEEETVMHVLWQCPAARDVWAESHRATQKWGAMETNLLKLWEDLEGKLNKIELAEVAVIMRGLWMRRNNFIFENKFLNPSSIIRSIRDSLKEHHLAEEGIADSSRRGDSRVEVIQKWSPPGANSFRANWDAACNVKHRKMGIDVIIRNENGKVTAIYCGIKGNVDQPVIAEGFAFKKVMELCRDLGLNKVIFEGDVQNIVKTVYSPNEDLSCFGSIIEDSKSFLSEWSNWVVRYTHINTNTVAHSLAKLALRSNVEQI